MRFEKTVIRFEISLDTLYLYVVQMVMTSETNEFY